MYRRLRSEAAQRGIRGLSPIVEEALRRLFEQPPHGDDSVAAAFAEAEGAWTSADVEDWERTRGEVWSTWRHPNPSSTPTS